jgi:hypothetical protein
MERGSVDKGRFLTLVLTSPLNPLSIARRGDFKTSYEPSLAPLYVVERGG